MERVGGQAEEGTGQTDFSSEESMSSMIEVRNLIFSNYVFLRITY